MLLDLELITAPTDALLTPEELRKQCSVDVGDDDELLASYLAAAVAHVDGYSGVLGRAVAPQEWRLYLEAFPRGSICLPLPPLLEVTSITYVDGDGATQTLVEATDYVVLAGERAEVALAYGVSWPTTRCQSRAVAVTFTCGFEPAGSAWPAKVEPIRAALKMMVAAMYEQREDWADLPGVRRALKPLSIPQT